MKTYYGNVIGWILCGCFWAVGIVTAFLPHAYQNTAPCLLFSAGAVLAVLFFCRIRFDENGFSRFGPCFLYRRIEYKNIVQFHLEFRDVRFPEIPTSVQYRLSGGGWERFESGLFSAKVQKALCSEFQSRIKPDLRLAQNESETAFLNLLFRLIQANRRTMLCFLFGALFFAGIGIHGEFRFHHWKILQEKWISLPVEILNKGKNHQTPLYRFTFRGKVYTGNQIVFDLSALPESDNGGFCIVNPEEPAESALTLSRPLSPAEEFLCLLPRRFSLLLGCILLIISLRFLRFRSPRQDVLDSYLKNFSTEERLRIFHAAHEKMRPPMQSAGKVKLPLQIKNGRYAAFYPGFSFRRFVVMDTESKIFYYRSLFSLLPAQSSVAFSEIDFLVAGEISKTTSVGIVAVLKDGRCYGLGVVKADDLPELGSILTGFAETLGRIPVTFM